MSSESLPGDSKSSKPSFQSSQTLKGFRDLLPKDAILKNRMCETLSRVFESFGFVPIQTPHLERAEALFGDASQEIKKQVYKFIDNGGREVALRFDLTVPFARYISEHAHEVGLPFKRWAIGSVFRGENPQAGRYREFTQCDFDFVGTTSLAADAEIVQVIEASMRTLGVQRFQIRINNRKVMNGLAAALGMPGKTAELLQEVDKLEKVGEEGVRLALKGEHGFSDSAVSELLAFVQLSRGDLTPEAVLEATRAYRDKNELLRQGLEELEGLHELLRAVGIGYPTYRIDLSIARGLGYYTGIVYETTLLDLPSIGSVCSGGRYDNLTQTFRKEPCPGVGASVGIDRLIAGLSTLGLLAAAGTPADVLILTPQSEDAPRALALGASLRHEGLMVEVYPEPHKLKRQFDYAKRSGHPFVVQHRREGSGFILERQSDGERSEHSSTKEIAERVRSHRVPPF